MPLSFDVYSLIRSKCVAEHCRKLGRSFSPQEILTLIANSALTLEQKHKAMRDLIENTEDCPFTDRFDGDITVLNDSLHEYVIYLLYCERHCLERFKNSDYYGVRFRNYASGFDLETYEPKKEGAFASPEAALEAVFMRFPAVRPRDICCTVYAFDWFDGFEEAEHDPPPGEPVCVVNARMNASGDILSIESDELYPVRERISDCFPDMPCPFRPGDILTRNSGSSAPFVYLSHSDDWEIHGFAVTDNGGICWMISWPFTDTELFTGEPAGEQRACAYISEYLRGLPPGRAALLDEHDMAEQAAMKKTMLEKYGIETEVYNT